MTELSFIIPGCLRRASKVTGVGYFKPDEVTECDDEYMAIFQPNHRFIRSTNEHYVEFPDLSPPSRMGRQASLPVNECYTLEEICERPPLIRQTNADWETEPTVFDDVEYWNEVMKIPLKKRIAAYKVSMMIHPVQRAFSVLKG
jgi:hypothetical protein